MSSLNIILGNKKNYINIEGKENYKFTTLLIINFFSWLIAMNNIVPISLLVCIEMIKFFQAILISWDFKIYDIANSRCAIVQSSGLNEELGQVHVFYLLFTNKLAYIY